MSILFFKPSIYYNTLGSHEPVSRIRHGDSVVTTTVDARGEDQYFQIVAQRPNPMTGPFFIEEAEPGDTLAVDFDRLWPNRGSGWTVNVLDHQVLEAEAFSELPPKEIIQWELNNEAGTVRLAKPIGALGSFEQKIMPFLGCFGTAPARKEFISTASSGEHGGNMDYRKFTAGTTAYLPVFEPGGLFFLGDGHALQGDGEIVGTGIETCLDVKFTVRVIKGKVIGWPRGEDENYIFTVGNAKPLELAVKHATTEMLRWLRDDFALGYVEASTLLGQCVEYEVGNVFNPAYTMACKLKKSILAAIRH